MVIDLIIDKNRHAKKYIILEYIILVVVAPKKTDREIGFLIKTAPN